MRVKRLPIKFLNIGFRGAGPPDVLVCDGERGLGASEIFTEKTISVRDLGANNSCVLSVAEALSRTENRHDQGSGGKKRHVSSQLRGCPRVERKTRKVRYSPSYRSFLASE